ncbi:MAG: class I SAM-dependent methyltransferase [Deltaproteobacteria bacterium]|nr:class I SAM-dependent methyltransferase [Candidatus Zymogenaceae bacterium]
MDSRTKSTDLSGEFAGLSVADAAAAYKEMADSVLATMYCLVADELAIRTKDRPAGGRKAAILDVGTGMGHLAAELGKRFADRAVVALDLSPIILSEARQRGGLPEGVRPLAGDATRLPIRDAAVDIIASYGAVHHIPDKTGLFAEIYRALAPGGLALIIDLNGRADRSVVDVIAGSLSKAAAGAFLESMDEAIAPDEAQSIIRAAGVPDFIVTTAPISRRAVAMNAGALRKAPLRVPPTAIIWGAYIKKAG